MVLVEANYTPETLKALRGQSVVLPDLDHVHNRWFRKVHPQLKDLEKDIDEKIFLFYPPGPIRKKMRAVLPALFGASWFPNASYGRLRTCTYLAMWLFAWDDETDNLNLYADMDTATAKTTFAKATKEFVHECIMAEDPQLDDLPGSRIPVIANFEIIARAVCPTYTIEQKTFFLNSLNYYVDSCLREQQYQHTQKFTTLEQYIQYRLGSGGNLVLFSLIEFQYEMQVSPSIMRSDEMEKIRGLANIMISLTNDVLSLKKEVNEGLINTLVPILYIRCGDLQTALAEADNIITSHANEFDRLSQKLLDSCANETKLYENVKKCLIGYQTGLTCNFYWGLKAPRYSLGAVSLSGGLEVVLG